MLGFHPDLVAVETTELPSFYYFVASLILSFQQLRIVHARRQATNESSFGVSDR